MEIRRFIDLYIQGPSERSVERAAILLQKEVDKNFNLNDLDAFCKKNFGIIKDWMWDLINDDPETGLVQWQLEGSYKEDENNQLSVYAYLYEYDGADYYNDCLFEENAI